MYTSSNFVVCVLNQFVSESCDYCRRLGWTHLDYSPVRLMSSCLYLSCCRNQSNAGTFNYFWCCLDSLPIFSLSPCAKELLLLTHVQVPPYIETNLPQQNPPIIFILPTKQFLLMNKVNCSFAYCKLFCFVCFSTFLIILIIIFQYLIYRFFFPENKNICCSFFFFFLLIINMQKSAQQTNDFSEFRYKIKKRDYLDILLRSTYFSCFVLCYMYIQLTPISRKKIGRD